MEKICNNCGHPMGETEMYCSNCGAKYDQAPEEKNVCIKCGQEIAPGAQFCMYCGAKQSGDKEEYTNYVKKGFDSFTSTINAMAGEEGKAEIHIRELFTAVFKKHTPQERDELFACGSEKTTPKEKDMITEWPKPWLYSRVFLMLALVFAGLYILLFTFQNEIAVPGAIFIGALVVPFTAIVFFWEVNVPRNISIIEAVEVFFVGGVASLIVTMILYQVTGAGILSYFGAIMVGFVEEIGKIAIVAAIVKRKNTKYILNGMLLGACVGAGFAVFETAGYAFTALLSSGNFNYMLDVLFLRAVLAIGAHVVWTAIAGAGLIIAKGEAPLTTDHVLNAKFLKFLLLVIVLHAIWDMPLPIPYFLPQWCLTAIALVTVLVLLNVGLKQVSNYVKKAQEQA